MRTNVTDQLYALRRPAAMAALIAAAGGGVAALAPRLALWRLDARVQALDTFETTTVATLPGSQTTPSIWLAGFAGVLVVAVALLVALDRPPAKADRLLFGGAVTIAVIAATGLLTPPAAAAFAGDPHAAELLGAPVALPTGVGIELLVRPAFGSWMVLSAAVVIVLGTVAARRG